GPLRGELAFEYGLILDEWHEDRPVEDIDDLARSPGREHPPWILACPDHLLADRGAAGNVFGGDHDRHRLVPGNLSTCPVRDVLVHAEGGRPAEHQGQDQDESGTRTHWSPPSQGIWDEGTAQPPLRAFPGRSGGAAEAQDRRISP